MLGRELRSWGYLKSLHNRELRSYPQAYGGVALRGTLRFPWFLLPNFQLQDRLSDEDQAGSRCWAGDALTPWDLLRKGGIGGDEIDPLVRGVDLQFYGLNLSKKRVIWVLGRILDIYLINFFSDLTNRPGHPILVVFWNGNPRLFQGNLGWWNIVPFGQIWWLESRWGATC